MPASDKTAMGVAKQRLIETSMPEAERVVTDPYAEYFVPGASAWVGLATSGWVTRFFQESIDC